MGDLTIIYPRRVPGAAEIAAAEAERKAWEAEAEKHRADVRDYENRFALSWQGRYYEDKCAGQHVRVVVCGHTREECAASVAKYEADHPVHAVQFWQHPYETNGIWRCDGSRAFVCGN